MSKSPPGKGKRHPYGYAKRGSPERNALAGAIRRNRKRFGSKYRGR